MKKNSFKNMDKPELISRLSKLKKDIVMLKFAITTEKNKSLIKEKVTVKKDIARILTELNSSKKSNQSLGEVNG